MPCCSRWTCRPEATQRQGSASSRFGFPPIAARPTILTMPLLGRRPDLPPPSWAIATAHRAESPRRACNAGLPPSIAAILAVTPRLRPCDCDAHLRQLRYRLRVRASALRFPVISSGTGGPVRWYPGASLIRDVEAGTSHRNATPEVDGDGRSAWQPRRAGATCVRSSVTRCCSTWNIDLASATENCVCVKHRAPGGDRVRGRARAPERGSSAHRSMRLPALLARRVTPGTKPRSSQ